VQWVSNYTRSRCLRNWVRIFLLLRQLGGRYLAKGTHPWGRPYSSQWNRRICAISRSTSPKLCWPVISFIGLLWWIRPPKVSLLLHWLPIFSLPQIFFSSRRHISLFWKLIIDRRLSGDLVPVSLLLTKRYVLSFNVVLQAEPTFRLLFGVSSTPFVSPTSSILESDL